MHEPDSQAAANPPERPARLRRGKDQDRSTQRGAIERRTQPGATFLPAVREPPATHRRISVKGSGGVTATVIVMVQRGTVWLSIQPLFTWEAIMTPEKVDELMRTLAQAREAAGRCRS